MTVEPYVAAAVQAEPCWLDMAAGVEKSIALIEEAASNDAKLIVFPEAWIPGYPLFLWLGPQAWGMQFIQRYHENSMTVGSPEYVRLAKAAKDNNINVAFGVSERDMGSLYLAQFMFSSEGDAIYNRRKLKPTHVERALYGEGDGSDLHVQDVDGLGRFGGLCCWEHLQPLSKYAMYSQGEQIHAAAWPSFCLYRGGAYALGPEVNMAASQVYAVEGSTFVVAATQVTGEAGLELFCDSDDQRGLLNATGGGGTSRIYGPDGQIISNLLEEGEEGIVYGTIDISMIPLAKAAADPAGHYSRPDATQLLFNKKPQRAVQIVGEDDENDRGARSAADLTEDAEVVLS